MIKKLRDQFEKSLKLLDKLFSEDNIRYLKISNIEISKFMVPEISANGSFLKGPTEYREVYNEQIQSILSEVKLPSLYFFELLDPNPKLVHYTYHCYSKNQRNANGIKNRVCSAVNKDFDHMNDQNYRSILYVGKSKKPVSGRIVVHFGYYEKGIAGLQLVYWGKEIDLKFNLHVFEIQNEKLIPFLELYEKIFFENLKPIIGIK